MSKNNNSKFEDAKQKTAQLLISGGDDRLLLNANGLNKYGCSPFPDDEILAFSSSTASPVLTSGFEKANALRQQFEQAAFSQAIHDYELNRQKTQWRELLNLSENSELIFSPSGTDLHRLVASQVADHTRIIMVESNETGSGVAAVLEQQRGIEVVNVPLRFKNGLSRPISEIDNQVIFLVEQAQNQNREVLLILVDQSKTGMIAPSTNCAIELKKCYQTTLNVLVDACQFRLSANTVQAYLAQNFMLALTGSKFFAAPSFSAMLLLPPEMKFNAPNADSHFGLLLRMEITLQQYQTFATLSNQQICSVMSEFSGVISDYFAQSPFLQLFENPNLVRDGLVTGTQWDALPTIFPFLVLKNNKPLSFDQTFALYQQLPLQNPRCQLGQPVICGNEQAALRFCLSAPLIVKAAQSQQHLADCLENARQVLKTLEKCIFNCA